VICFVINYYGEPTADLEKLVAAIGTHYGSNAQVFILGDGVTPPAASGAFSVAFPERLKQRKHGGKWTHRYLDFYLTNSTATHLIKIDPDTQVLGSAVDLPVTDSIFCRIAKRVIGKREWWMPLGGALGFTRGMAQRIVSEEMFNDPIYANKARYHDQQDWMLEDIAMNHGLPLIDRKDFSIWQPAPEPGAAFFHASEHKS
jgi:hypothetical protein